MRATLPRLKSILRYLTMADAIYKWRIHQSQCVNCNGKYFISLRDDPFMTRCLRCHANLTNLALIPVIKKHLSSSVINKAWEMSTYGATFDYLKKNIPYVVGTEYIPGAEPGEIIKNVMNQDVQKLSFEDACFDLITSNQVFEHVPDDIRGYKECFRVLRPGGALIFTVPLYENDATECLAEIKDNEILFHRKAEYHDSRKSGPKSVLTFWHHSRKDICQRVASVGFTAKLIDVKALKSQSNAQQVIYAIK